MQRSAFYHNLRSNELDFFYRHILPGSRDDLALDLGCGTGEFASRLAAMNYRVLGIDLSREMLSLARRKTIQDGATIHYVEGDVGMLPIGLGSSVMVAFGVLLNHIEDWATFLREISARLRTGGVLLLDIDNLAGIDTITAHLSSAAFNGGILGGARDLIESFSAELAERRSSGSWLFRSNGHFQEITLHYLPTRTLLRVAQEFSLTLIDIRSINVLTTLLPWFIRSSSFAGEAREGSTKENLTKLCQKVDRLLSSGKLASRFAANSMFAFRKT